MFKRIFLPLIAMAPIYATEAVNPGVDWCKTAEIANQPATPESEPTEKVQPAAESVTRILYWLNRGIGIMEEDTNKEREALMRSVAATARDTLVKLMALTKIGRQADNIKASLILELYQAYVRFNVKLEATYSQAAAPADTATDAAPATEESPTT